jgi:NADPH:quinone reductase
MRAIQITTLGGLDVLDEAEVAEPVPGPGQVVVEVEAAGINFADIEQVAGTYQPPVLPFVPGAEVVGRTPDGRRVMALARRAYATRAAVHSADLVEIPEDLAAGRALALLVQGLTAWHLLRSAARLEKGESVVVNAAAGGVGHLAVQLAREFGAGRVIATASTEAKRALALELGADAAVAGDAEGYAERVIEANGGRAADIVLDAVGGPVFDAAPGALAPFGRLVGYGASSGIDAAPIQLERLSETNLAVVGFWVAPLLRRPGAQAGPLREMLALTLDGRLRPAVGGEYGFAQVREALGDLAGRRSTGKLLLRP